MLRRSLLLLALACDPIAAPAGCETTDAGADSGTVPDSGAPPCKRPGQPCTSHAECCGFSPDTLRVLCTAAPGTEIYSCVRQ